MDGVFAIDDSPVPIASVLEYDRLGMLTWVSEEMRAWAYEVGNPAPAPPLQPAQAIPIQAPLQPVNKEKLPRLNKANWIPALVMVGVLIAWAVLIRVTGLAMSRPDITSLGAVILMGIFALFAIPAAVAQFSPRAPKQGLRVTTWILYALVAVPLCFGLVWGVADILNPVPERADGALPDLVALMGHNQRDVGRILNGSEVETDKYAKEDIAANSKTWGTPTAKSVLYSLEDLNRLNKRPLAQKVRENGSTFVNTVMGDKAPKHKDSNSDAEVTVYYSPEGKAVGAKLSVSRLAAQEVVGSESQDAILRGVGFKAETRVVAAPEWAQKVTTALAGLDNKDYWGFGKTAEGWMGYEVQVNHLAALMLNATDKAVDEQDDLGDISVTVAPKLIDWTTPDAASATGQTQSGGGSTAADNSDSSSQIAPSPETSGAGANGSSSSVVGAAARDYASQLGGTPHKGKQLYFIIGESVDSEAAAQKKLDAATPLFGDMQTYFIVQKSDNFEGMRPGWWVVIEAYTKKPEDNDLQLAKRAFPDAYVKPATVKTDDPIPVYEELVPGAN